MACCERSMFRQTGMPLNPFQDWCAATIQAGPEGEVALGPISRHNSVSMDYQQFGHDAGNYALQKALLAICRRARLRALCYGCRVVFVRRR